MSKPDYSKPGSDPPPNNLDEDEKKDLEKAKSSTATDIVYRKVPTPLECDTKYYLDTTVREQLPPGGTYADLNMKWLYDVAMQRAKASVKDLKCPVAGSCGPFSTWVQFVGWDFKSDFTKAQVRIIIGAMCPTDIDDVPEGEDDDVDFDDEPRGERGELEHSDEYFTTSDGNMFVECPGEKEVMYVYSIAARGDVKDYEPYVAEARSRAKAFFDLVECGAGCKKGVNVFYVEWGLDVATVKVYVWAQILCGKPPPEGSPKKDGKDPKKSDTNK